MSTYVHNDRRLKLQMNGELVSVRRRDLGMTQAALAIKARLSRSTIAAIEQMGDAGQPVHRRTWRQIAKALGYKQGDDPRELLIYDEYIEFEDSAGVYHKDPVTLYEKYDADRIEEYSGEKVSR